MAYISYIILKRKKTEHLGLMKRMSQFRSVPTAMKCFFFLFAKQEASKHKFSRGTFTCSLVKLLIRKRNVIIVHIQQLNGNEIFYL